MTMYQQFTGVLIFTLLLGGLYAPMVLACTAEQEKDAAQVCDCPPEEAEDPESTDTQIVRKAPVIQLEVSIESPNGVLPPGTYLAHPVLGEEDFTELILSKDNRVMTRFPLRLVPSFGKAKAPGAGFPVIRTEAKLSSNRKAVIFTVSDGFDRFESGPLPVVPESLYP